METSYKKAVFHPWGWGMEWIIPNIVPQYVAMQMGLKSRDLSGFLANATAYWHDPSLNYHWNIPCPKCTTFGLLFQQLADAFGYECFQHVFEEYYALPQGLHVGNSDEKASVSEPSSNNSTALITLTSLPSSS
jgi:hypothetical protein